MKETIHQTPALSVRRLSTEVLSDISLDVQAGESIALSGPSGAGKSRLLRAIADLDVNRGEVHLHGVSRESIPPPEWRRAVALLPAEPAWWADSAGAHFPALCPVPIRELGLPSGILDSPVDRLSSGERQRLALARILCCRPRVLLLDEPTANLDRVNAARVEALVNELRLADGLGVLWVTHEMSQATRVAARQLTLETGRVVDARTS